MRFVLLLTLAACSGPATDAPLEDNRLTLDDVDELLARVEALEAEVASLRNSGAPVGIDADADGDGLREWDGLPVGTRRGDVLWEWACPEGADQETPLDVPLPPEWMAPPADERIAPGFGCYIRHDGGSWGGPGAYIGPVMSCDKDHPTEWQCIAL